MLDAACYTYLSRAPTRAAYIRFRKAVVAGSNPVFLPNPEEVAQR